MAFKRCLALQDALCKALDIRPELTARVVIDLNPETVARVRITQYLEAEQQDALVRIFSATSFEENSAS